MTISPALASDRFSWSRVGAILRLMLPRMRSLITVCIIMGLASSLMVWLMGKFFFGSIMLSIFILVPAITFYVSPIFVTETMTARQMSLLPASSGEKLTALLIPVISLGLVAYYLPQFIATFAVFHGPMSTHFDTAMMVKFVHGWSPLFYVFSYLGAMFPAMVSLFCIISSPTHRWRAGAIAVGALFAQGLIGGAYGAIAAFTTGFKAGLAGEVIVDQKVITQLVFKDMYPYMWVYVILINLLSILFIWLSYRRLASRQL